jgi:XTP/dITP diphosphohydrolase
VIVYCATTNAGKLREFRKAAEIAGCEVEVVPGLREIPAPDETGATFEANAALKAEYYGAHIGGYLFADDSGLEVDALGGAPGVHSARYAGGAGDAANNALLLRNLEGVEHRLARFVSVIALVKDARLVRTFRGTVEGEIALSESGPHGFGYDPLFYYPPFGCTFGEADLPRKANVSHRGNALRQMFEYLAGIPHSSSIAT